MTQLPKLGKKRFIKELPFILASMAVGKKRILRNLLTLRRKIDLTIDFLALWDDQQGNHPKHRLTDYHQFFIERISPDQVVLDIGCGNGNVAKEIACRTGAHVIGVDKSRMNINSARKKCNISIEFLCADVMSMKIPNADVIILSNVLEHLRLRDVLLKRLYANSCAKMLLVRVPQYERHWTVPYGYELGLDMRLDSTHYIEHRYEDILSELDIAGWDVKYLECRWGEYRIEARPKVSQ